MSKIEWTGKTLNPIRARRRDTGQVGWHCEKVSSGCANCYAETFNARMLPNGGTGLPYTKGSRDQVEIFLDEKTLIQPLRWRKPTKVFLCSMTDLFAEFVPFEMILRMFAVMSITPQHIYQLLTKRPERAAEFYAWLTEEKIKSVWGDYLPYLNHNDEINYFVLGGIQLPLPNVWIGTSVENQDAADKRIPELLKCHAAVRFLSVEPMLGPVDARPWMPRDRFYNAICEKCGHVGSTEFFKECRYQDDADVVCPKCDKIILANEVGKIDWVIVGGETGKHIRPLDLGAATDVRDHCRSAGVAFWMKQDSHRLPGQRGRIPDDLWIQELPSR